MPEIRILDPHVADLIAAGEVVERPASVVKELAENAVDAGAQAVTIEIQRGGMALIRVTDNGCGIPQDQCARAFQRHATSKLRSPQDLAAIGTLGFRGEALAAISAVARVELITCPQDQELGTALQLEGGKLLGQEEAGCPPGTTMVVRDLFYNTPARLKFMRRDAAEGAAVFAVVQRLALSHPEISWKFIRDGRQELLTPGDGDLRAALYAVFGRDLALGFLPVESDGEAGKVSGFASMPACCRGTRGYQHFFVNGRQVKSKLLTSAVERAYENQKMVGKFPGCVLQLEVKPSEVDVNVHPAKTEVKFLYERKVFDGVYYAVLSALGEQQVHPLMEISRPQPREAPPSPLEELPLLPSTLRLNAEDAGAAAAEETLPALPLELPPQAAPVREKPARTEKEPPAVTEPPAERAAPVRSALLRPLPKEEPEEIQPPDPVPLDPPALLPQTPDWRLVGEVLETYLIVEQGDEIHFIDKHAAHERLNFDRLQAQEYTPMSQTLLEPLVIELPPQEVQALLDEQALLDRYGFACTSLGGGTLSVEELPDLIAPAQAEEVLGEIAQALLSGAASDPARARDALLHTMACKAAVKGGQHSSREELAVVAQAVLSGQVKYCPHGRPVAITMRRQELERQFKRL